ncbi:hypothetical protein [Spirosoma agri]|uniref:Uncharacterized protein n=1 Tax=Spirosoma agri TaxID=1987381 RepID=A0A6M0IE29_9BACT|nr:hypothetical protein [Spirosoma agri]NEU65601.1 hypothetical protein [Spirosoma agri]
MATFTAEAAHIFRRLFPVENYQNQEARSTTSLHPSWFGVPLAGSSEKSRRVAVFQCLFLCFLLAIPVFIYYKTIFENAFNFPYEDDFNSALSFISDYAFGNLTFWGKLKLIFSQYNEHRIVFDRLVFLTDYALFSELNFSHLIIIGNLSLLLICALFLTVAFPRLPLNQKLLYLLPVAYSLFLFQYWELSTWSMAALQNLYVIPFAMFSLYSLSKSGRNTFLLACGAAILATFTSGNGMFTFLAGAALLLLTQSYRKLVLWLVIMASTIALYFWGYIRPPYHPDIVDSLFNHTGRAIGYFFTLTGMLVGPGRATLSILFGALSLLVSVGLLGYLLYTKRFTDYLPLIGWLLFLYLTCLSLMATRSGMGIGQAATPRYGIVVVMLFATQSVLALETITHRYLRLGVLIGYLSVALFVYLSAINQDNRRRIDDRKRTLQYSSAFYNDNPANLFLHWANPGIAKTIFADAQQKKIFQVPAVTFSDLKTVPQPISPAQLTATNNITTDIHPYETGNFLVLYRAGALLNGSLSRKTTIQLLARSATDCYAFDVKKHAWDDLDDHTLDRKYTQPGFSCVLDKKDLRPGHYMLWLHLVDGETNAYQPLTITLDV